MPGTIKVALATVLAVVSAMGVALVGAPQRAEALSPADFDPGYIISDQRFFDSNSMSIQDIQNFLNIRVPNCAAANGYPCLKNYSTATFSRAAVEPGHCSAFNSQGVESAAQIIWKVGQACGISPMVLLATLQKEQGLVTQTSPTERQYRVAMGYGCPDTAPCDAQFYGFYNQVYKAAWQFRQYTNYPDRRYRIGQIPIQYHPNAACGAPTVFVRNQATANLYNYTPYQPNAAAMASWPGAGDGCSSYGNRNFWYYFNLWFGSSTGPINPFGSVDVMQAAPGGIRVAGWAVDLDFADSIQVHIYVDGVGTPIVAGLNRPDVGALYPSTGSKHGFDTIVPVTFSGVHTVCLYGINVGPGSHTILRCALVSASTGAPTGTLDVVQPGNKAITVGGWAVDPDRAGPVAVHVYVDNTVTMLTADRDRPDIAAAFPGWGAPHGYSATIAATPGPHRVCAYAINDGAEGNPTLGCRTVVVQGVFEQGRSPIGSVDAASGVTGGIFVGGWALDPDTDASIPVHVYVDGAGTALTASAARSDIAAAYPLYGPNHGFSATITATPGAHNVCVYAINTGPGPHTTLTCRTVVVPGANADLGRSPVGSFDVATASGAGFLVGGWAVDPDTSASIPVHVYIGTAGTAITADKARSDIAALFPALGAAHGFSDVIPAPVGTSQLCAYAINTGVGPHTLLGCKTVTR